MSENKPEFNEFNPLDDFNEQVIEKKPKKRWSVKKIFWLGILGFVLSSPLIVYGSIQNSTPDIPYGNFVNITEPDFLEEIDESTFNLGSNFIEITVLESILNQVIYSSIIEQINRNYAPQSLCRTLDCNYVFHQLDEDGEFLFGIKAIWLRFSEDKILIHAAMDIQGPILIQTVAIAELSLDSNLSEVQLRLDRIRLHRLRIPNVFLSVAQRFIPDDFEIDLPNPYAEAVDVDLSSRSATLDQRNVSQIIPYTRARIDSIELREGGMIVRVRYGN